MSSLILRTAMRLIVPLSLLFAAYMALKGHNHPGGGFIGGLIAAVAIALYRMSFGAQAFRQLVPVHPRDLIVAGLSLAMIATLTPMLFGKPALTSKVTTVEGPFGGEMHLASALVFDAGVLLVVVGVSIGMIVRLSEELER